MSSKKEEAIEFARQNPISQLVTIKDGFPYSRIMYAAKIEDDLTIWFATSESSRKISHIRENSNSCVTFHKEGKYLRITGRAEIFSDMESKKTIWKDDWTRYWKLGIDDPDYIVIKIKPVDAEYYDTEKDMSPEKLV